MTDTPEQVPTILDRIDRIESALNTVVTFFDTLSPKQLKKVLDIDGDGRVTLKEYSVYAGVMLAYFVSWLNTKGALPMTWVDYVYLVIGFLLMVLGGILKDAVTRKLTADLDTQKKKFEAQLRERDERITAQDSENRTLQAENMRLKLEAQYKQPPA